MLHLWYIDSSYNRNKIHTYATFKEYFQIVYSTNVMLYHTYIYSAICIRDNVITILDVSWYFYKSKEIQFFMQTIDKKERQIY